MTHTQPLSFRTPSSYISSPFNLPDNATKHLPQKVQSSITLLEKESKERTTVLVTQLSDRPENRTFNRFESWMKIKAARTDWTLSGSHHCSCWRKNMDRSWHLFSSYLRLFTHPLLNHCIGRPGLVVCSETTIWIFRFPKVAFAIALQKYWTENHLCRYSIKAFSYACTAVTPQDPDAN